MASVCAARARALHGHARAALLATTFRCAQSGCSEHAVRQLLRTLSEGTVLASRAASACAQPWRGILRAVAAGLELDAHQDQVGGLPTILLMISS